MGDPFSVAASAFGVIGVAGQLIDGFTKLYSFCDDVKRAPEEVEAALANFKALSPQLDLIAQLGATSPAGSSSLDQCLVVSRTGLQQINALLSDIQNDIAQRNVRGRIHAAIKKKSIEGYQKRLERTNQTLMIACLAFQSHQTQRHYALSVSGFAQLTLAVSSAGLNAASGQEVAVPTRSNPQSLLAPSIYADDPTDERAPLRKEESTHLVSRKKKFSQPQVARVRARIPGWWVTTVWEFDVYRSARGWSATLQSYNVVPRESEIFQACRRADLGTIRRLLDSGKASLNDYDKLGRSLVDYVRLGYSSDDGDEIARKVEILQFFLAHHKSFMIDVGRSALWKTCIAREFTWSAGASTSALESTWTLAASVADEFHDFAFLYQFEGPPQMLALVSDLIRPLDTDEKPEVCVSRLLTEWISAFKKYRRGIKTDIFEAVLAAAGLPLCEAVKHPHLASDLLEFAIRYLGLELGSLDSINPDLGVTSKESSESADRWRNVICSVVTGGGTTVRTDCDLLDSSWLEDFLVGYYEGMTQAYCRETCAKCIALADGSLQIAAAIMCEFGFDLVRAGEIQHQKGFVTPFGVRMRRYEPSSRYYDYFFLRLVGFEHGPNPEDWRPYWSNPRDEWAGEFWEMVEHPPSAMPGAWSFDD